MNEEYNFKKWLEELWKLIGQVIEVEIDLFQLFNEYHFTPEDVIDFILN